MAKESLARKYLNADNFRAGEIQIVDEIDLDVGVAGDGAAADSTGIKVDGEFRETLKAEHLDRVDSAVLVVGKASSAGDDVVDIILRDYTAAADVASVSVTGASNHAEAAVTPGNLTVGNDIGIRATVTGASGTGGATFDVLNAKLILVKRIT